MIIIVIPLCAFSLALLITCHLYKRVSSKKLMFALPAVLAAVSILIVVKNAEA